MSRNWVFKFLTDYSWDKVLLQNNNYIFSKRDKNLQLKMLVDHQSCNAVWNFHRDQTSGFITVWFEAEVW